MAYLVAAHGRVAQAAQALYRRRASTPIEKAVLGRHAEQRKPFLDGITLARGQAPRPSGR